MGRWDKTSLTSWELVRTALNLSTDHPMASEAITSVYLLMAWPANVLHFIITAYTGCAIINVHPPAAGGARESVKVMHYLDYIAMYYRYINVQESGIHLHTICINCCDLKLMCLLVAIIPIFLWVHQFDTRKEINVHVEKICSLSLSHLFGYS